jgi:hypothetical protein
METKQKRSAWRAFFVANMEPKLSDLIGISMHTLDISMPRVRILSSGCRPQGVPMRHFQVALDQEKEPDHATVFWSELSI